MTALTLRAPEMAINRLTRFWAAYFREIPVCTTQDCCQVAIEVDPFFPYLDDYNRCEKHRVTEKYSTGGMPQPVMVS